jgi:hypothetical protein
MSIQLSSLAIFLGLGVAVSHIYALVNPSGCRAVLRRFPRSLPCGYALMAVGTVWFLWNLRQEAIADFAAYKPMMLLGFAVLGVLSCVFVSDFLAVRGLALVLLLLAKLMVDSARWADTAWRLVVVVWAYLMVIAGIWFTVAPWRARDILFWWTATDQRMRVASGIRIVFGLFLAVLGFTVFRS